MNDVQGTTPAAEIVRQIRVHVDSGEINNVRIEAVASLYRLAKQQGNMSEVLQLLSKKNG